MFTTNCISETNDLSILSSDSLERLARSTSFIKRKRQNFSAHGFVLSLLKSVIVGKTTLTKTCFFMEGSSECKYSKQALQKRMSANAETFIQRVVAEALSSNFLISSGIDNSDFNHIYVEDASTVKVHRSHNDVYKSTGSFHHATGGFKVDVSLDILTGNICHGSVHPSKTNDKVPGKRAIANLEEGDLLIRDLGYYSVEGFKEIEQRSAFWLSKIPTHANATERVSGKPLDDILARTTENSLDLDVGLMNGHAVRLIAVRASEQQAEQKRRKAKLAAKGQGKTPRKNSFLRNGWHIAVCNIGRDKLNSEQIMKLYRLRWQIEILFRAWKGSAQLESCFKQRKNLHHLKCLVLISLLWFVLTLKFSAQLQLGSKHEVSTELVAHWLSIEILSRQDFKFLEKRPQCRIFKDSRKRSSLLASTLNSLS